MKRYSTIDGRLNRKTAHFRLASVGQKCRVLQLRIIHEREVIAVSLAVVISLQWRHAILSFASIRLLYGKWYLSGESPKRQLTNARQKQYSCVVSASVEYSDFPWKLTTPERETFLVPFLRSICRDKWIKLKLAVVKVPEVKLTCVVCVAFDSLRIADKLWTSCGWKVSWRSFSAQSS